MIDKAIESVLAQTYTNWELIIVDDGSTDNTRNIISLYNDNRIIYFYQDNKGKSAARNAGIEKSTGEFICFLDDDDYYLPEFLSKFYNRIEEENFNPGLYMCDVVEEDENGQRVLKEINEKYIKSPPLFLWINGRGYFSFVTSREIFNAEKFDTRFPLGQDYHLLIRIALKLPLFYIPEVLCIIRNHPERSVVKEYKSEFKINGRNQLDFLNDLLLNHFKELNKFIPSNLIYNKYNKIAYFYASTALRRKKIEYALKLMKSIKWGGTFYKVLYYKMSIFIRSFYYKF